MIWTINSFNLTKPNIVCTNRYGIYNQGGVWQYMTMIVLLQEPFECVKVLYTLYAIYDCMCSLSIESNSPFCDCSVPSHPVVIYMCICSVINKMILPKFTYSYFQICSKPFWIFLVHIPGITPLNPFLCVNIHIRLVRLLAPDSQVGRAPYNRDQFRRGGGLGAGDSNPLTG